MLGIGFIKATPTTYLMAHRAKASRPIMCPTARFHEDEGGRLAGNQRQQLPPRHGSVRFERACGRHHTDLKHVFGEVNANDRLLGHGGLLFVDRSALSCSIIPERSP